MVNYYIAKHNSELTPILKVKWCRSFFSRFLGLMFRSSLPEGEGILLDQGRDSRVDSSIHMFFMRFDIAAIWVSSAGVVVDKCLARRWRPIYLPRKAARYVLEANPSLLKAIDIDDQLVFNEIM